MARRHNFQTLSWFLDLRARNLLDLDPPYQRRSVWNQSFRNYFVDTILLGYPSPAIFLFEQISDEGRSEYHVVDGKQRLTTLFDFAGDKFPVSDDCPKVQLRGQYFRNLDSDTRKSVWGYQFLVEYIASDDQAIIDSIFDRLNRNVDKLTAQELRHARFDGEFISAAEELSQWMETALPKNFPQIAARSRKQMKEVEFTSLLLLLIEDGPKSYSQDDLDKAYSARDEGWEQKTIVEAKFKHAIEFIDAVLDARPNSALTTSRLRNQADFYSLVGAIVTLKDDNTLPPADVVADRLIPFIGSVDNEEARAQDSRLNQYYEAARSASNDRGPRETRIAYVKNLLMQQ